MALSRHGGRRCTASGGARDLCPRSWAGNGPIGPAAVGLEPGKEKGRKKKEKKRKWVGWGFNPGQFQKISKGFPFSNHFFSNIKVIWISSSKIDLREHTCTTELIKQIINPRQRVLILDSNLIQGTIIHAQPLGTILLPDKNHRGS
jgi:hypothetical protein